jgi:hypothetical protein
MAWFHRSSMAVACVSHAGVADAHPAHSSMYMLNIKPSTPTTINDQVVRFDMSITYQIQPVPDTAAIETHAFARVLVARALGRWGAGVIS